MAAMRTKRGVGYSHAELDSLLDVIEEILPLSSMDWDLVTRNHKTKYPDEDRKAESIKRKFQDLYRTKMGTGNPHIPPEVRRAKEIQKLREEKLNSSDCEGNDDLAEAAEATEQPPEPSENGTGNNDNRSAASNEDPAVGNGNPSSTRASLPVSRKRQKNSDPLDGFKEMLQMQMMMRQQDRQLEDERRMREREEERRRWEEEMRARRRTENLMERMLVTIMAQNASRNAPLPDLMQLVTNIDDERNNDEVEGGDADADDGNGDGVPGESEQK